MIVFPITYFKSGSSYCDEYQAVYDVFTTPPSDDIATAQNIMVDGLVTNNVWAKLDIFQMYAQTVNSAGEALINWINPGTFDATAVNVPAFVALEGFTGNTVGTRYINTNWNPTSHGINYIQNSATIGVYIRTNVAENQNDIGTDTAPNTYIITRYASNTSYVRNNSATTLNTSSQTDSRGMWINTRLSVNDQDLYRNKIKIINGATLSTGVPNENIYVLALNNAGVPSGICSKQISLVFGGGGLTQIDVNNLTDTFEIYMNSNNLGIIS